MEAFVAGLMGYDDGIETRGGSQIGARPEPPGAASGRAWRRGETVPRGRVRWKLLLPVSWVTTMVSKRGAEVRSEHVQNRLGRLLVGRGAGEKQCREDE